MTVEWFTREMRGGSLIIRAFFDYGPVVDRPIKPRVDIYAYTADDSDEFVCGFAHYLWDPIHYDTQTQLTAFPLTQSWEKSWESTIRRWNETSGWRELKLVVARQHLAPDTETMIEHSTLLLQHYARMQGMLHALQTAQYRRLAAAISARLDGTIDRHNRTWAAIVPVPV